MTISRSASYLPLASGEREPRGVRIYGAKEVAAIRANGIRRGVELHKKMIADRKAPDEAPAGEDDVEVAPPRVLRRRK